MNNLKLENDLLYLSNKILKQTLLKENNSINCLNVYITMINSFLNKQTNTSIIKNILLIKDKESEGSYSKICFKNNYNIKKIEKYSHELKQCENSHKWIISRNKAFGIIEIPDNQIYFIIFDFINIKEPDFIVNILNNQDLNEATVIFFKRIINTQIFFNKNSSNINKTRNLILENNILGLWEYSLEKKELIINKKWLEFNKIQYKENTFSHNFLKTIIHPDDLHLIRKLLTTITRNKPAQFSIRLKSYDNKWKWYFGSSTISIDNDPYLIKGVLLDINKQKNEEHKFSMFETIIENSENAVVLLDLNGKIIYCNKTMTSKFNFKSKNILNKSFSSMINTKSYDNFTKGINALITNKIRNFNKEIWYDTKYKEPFPTIMNAFLVKKGFNNQKMITIIITNISDYYQSKKRLSNQLVLLQTLLNTIPSPIFIKDKKLRFTNCNKIFTKLLGLSLKNVIGKTTKEIFPENVAELSDKMDKHLLLCQEKISFETSLKFTDGTMHDVFIRKDLIYDENHLPNGLVGTIQDVTNSRKIERSLKESRHRLQAVIKGIPEILYILDEKLNFIDIFSNENIFQTTLSNNELIGVNCVDILDYAIYKKFRETLKNSLKYNKVGILEYNIFVDDLLKYYEARFIPLNYTIQNKKLILVINRDITENKTTQIQLKKARDEYLTLAENSSDIIMRFDTKHRHIFVNKAIEKYLPLKFQDFYLKTHKELKFPKNLCLKWKDLLDKTFITKETHFTTFSLDSLIGKVIFSWRLVPEFNEKNEVVTILTTAHDITTVVETRRELETIFDNSLIGILYVKKDNVISKINNTFSSMFGYTENEIIGKTTEILHPNLQSCKLFFETYYQTIKQGKTISHIQHEYKTKDGNIIWCELSGKSVNADNYEDGVIWIFDDITNEKRNNQILENETRVRKEITEALKSNNSLLISQQEASGEGIVIIDSDSNLLYFNTLFAKIWGIKHKDNSYNLVLNSKEYCKQIIKSPSNFDILINNLIEDKNKIKHLAVEFTNGNFYDVYTAPVKDNNNNNYRRGFYFHDITELKAVELQLKEAIEKANKANKIKSEFLANMSHEIRTPMNGILGMADFLEKTELNIKQRRYINLMKTAGRNLQAIINDILDISKIEIGKMTLEKHNFNFTELIEQTIYLFEIKAQKKNIKLTYDIDNSIPSTIFGDSVRIRQILTNLLGNSHKFTEKGKIHLEIKLINKKIKQINENIEIEFIVSDTGIGIDKEYHQSIFNHFVQGDSSITRKYGGTGLGLPIVKKLVELMGGKIKLISSSGKGSKFIFNIFLNISTENVESYQNKQINKYKINDKQNIFTNQIRILVAEDNEINQEYISELLKFNNINFTLVDNGKDALDLTIASYKNKGTKIDLILMDGQMPIMDGITSTKLIRKYEEENNILKKMPIIALTASALTGDKERFLHSGMNDYITKPVEETKLIAKIKKNLLQESKIITNKKNDLIDNQMVKEITEKAYLLDKEYLYNKFNGYSDFLDRLVKIFLDQYQDITKQIFENYRCNDFEKIKFFSHKLKGMVASFGDSILLNILQNIENIEESENTQDLDTYITSLKTNIERYILELKDLKNK